LRHQNLAEIVVGRAGKINHHRRKQTKLIKAR